MIIITYPHPVPFEIETINALFEAGLESLHLRKPSFSKEQTIEFIAKIESRFHDRIMLHSHYELLNTIELKGLHFTEKSKYLLPMYENTDFTKSLAIHDLADLRTINKCINYVLLSPIFPSISKEAYFKLWDYAELKLVLARHYNFDIIALGGISLAKINQVKMLGFNDFALLGSIWEPLLAGCAVEQVVETFKKFYHAA